MEAGELIAYLLQYPQNTEVCFAQYEVGYLPMKVASCPDEVGITYNPVKNRIEFSC